jgi:hypothetical protein
MKRTIVGLGFLALALLTPMLSSSEAPPDQNFVGTVYDLDYLGNQGWTQALLKTATGQTDLVATTKSEILQAVLEAGILNATSVSVTYRAGEPAELHSATLRLIPACREKGCIEEVRCTSEECFAKLTGYSEIRTTNPRALGILLTAVKKKKAVEYLDVNQRGEIVRVKINVP